MRIAVSDPLLLPRQVDPVGFLLERVESWAMGTVAAGGRVLDIGSRRPVPDEEGPHGLVTTLVGLAVDAPRLVERIEAGTRWVELEDAVGEAVEGAEIVLVRSLGSRARRVGVRSSVVPPRPEDEAGWD